MSKKNNLTIILPTLNEEENLKLLIPELFEATESLNLAVKILVVDDNSTDGTFELVENLSNKYNNLDIYVRTEEGSLPLSIRDGITKSDTEFVMWIDADGSMDAKSVKRVLSKFIEDNRKVFIGSRFVDGGGYKGVKSLSSRSFFNAVLNVKRSKDSVLGMIVSILFNKLLYLIFNSEVKDITSGFIVLRKDYVNQEVFKRATYGEYFIYLIEDLLRKNIEIIEIGYVCLTREHGESKTASSIIQLINRGIPYIKATMNSRFK